MKENPPNQQLPGDPSLPSSPEAINALSEHIPSDLSYAVEDFFRLPELQYFMFCVNEAESFTGRVGVVTHCLIPRSIMPLPCRPKKNPPLAGFLKALPRINPPFVAE